MKIKDFLKGLASTAGITNADLDVVLAASVLNDIEVPDSFNNQVHNSYLTRDRALNDANLVSEIQKKSNKSAYEAFDIKINDFLPFVADQELVNKIKSEPQSFQKWDILKAGLKGTLDTMKEENKNKENKDANKILEEKNNEIKALQDAHKREIAAQNDKLNDIFVNSTLKGKILAYNFADPFKPLKDGLAEMVINKVKSGYKVATDDKGGLKLLQPAGDSWVEAFEGNEKLTIDKLLEKETQQFIAVSNGNGAQEKKETYVPEQQNLAKATLAEMRRMATPTLAN